MFEKDGGIGPAKKLLVSDIFYRFVRVPIQSGIAPINLFMFSARLISL
jgi:hypothetical protein